MKMKAPMAGRLERRHTPHDRDLSLDAVPFDKGVPGLATPLLNAAQRRRLAALSTLLHVAPRTTLYREGETLSWIYIIGQGIVKSFRELPSGRRRVVAFLFPRDAFGLASNGHYVNTARTITSSTIYRIPHDELAT